MTKVDTNFFSELQKYGAGNFNACYNCGNCTAVCGLTEENANFPRMFIRYGMLGLKKDILKSKELWLCYSCGDCTATCPREAKPGEYMAALRRYAIANYEPTGLTKLMFKSNLLYIIISLVLAVILGFFLFTMKPDHIVARWIFKVMPFDVIHDMGMFIFIITGLSVFIGLLKMIIQLSRVGGKKENESKTSVWKKLSSAVNKVVYEISTMKRHQTCDQEEDTYWVTKSRALQPWFVHWNIMWGFIGLLIATILDFLFKDPATNIWLPSRILGTIGGIMLMYGTSLAIFYRIKKPTPIYSVTKLYDWIFLLFLWFAGVTGFWLEIAVGFEWDSLFTQVIFIIHTIISMELVLLFAFSKFAHAVYRPVALFIHNF